MCVWLNRVPSMHKLRLPVFQVFQVRCVPSGNIAFEIGYCELVSQRYSGDGYEDRQRQGYERCKDGWANLSFPHFKPHCIASTVRLTYARHIQIWRTCTPYVVRMCFTDHLHAGYFKKIINIYYRCMPYTNTIQTQYFYQIQINLVKWIGILLLLL